MLTFRQIRLTSVSLASAKRIGGKRHLPAGDGKLIISEIVERAAASSNPELADMAKAWMQDGGRGYLVPVVAEVGGTLFAGYIDTIAGALTIQRVRISKLHQAMGFAICASDMRSRSDRSGNHLPTRVLPDAKVLIALLEDTEAAPPMTRDTAAAPPSCERVAA